MIPAVPRKWFESADCDTIYTIYESIPLYTYPNPFEAHIVAKGYHSSMHLFFFVKTRKSHNGQYVPWFISFCKNLPLWCVFGPQLLILGSV